MQYQINTGAFVTFATNAYLLGGFRRGAGGD
jgi:hypothetical protein